MSKYADDIGATTKPDSATSPLHVAAQRGAVVRYVRAKAEEFLCQPDGRADALDIDTTIALDAEINRLLPSLGSGTWHDVTGNPKVDPAAERVHLTGFRLAGSTWVWTLSEYEGGRMELCVLMEGKQRLCPATPDVLRTLRETPR